MSLFLWGFSFSWLLVTYISYPLEVFYFMLDIIHKMKQKLQMKSPTIKSTVFSLLGREHTGNGHFGVIRGWAGLGWAASVIRFSPLWSLSLLPWSSALSIFWVWPSSHAGSSVLRGRQIMCVFQVLLLAESCLLSIGRLNNCSLSFWLGPPPFYVPPEFSSVSRENWPTF